MGLDIHLITDNYQELHNAEYMANYDENFNKYSLSREFCYLMCRDDVVEHTPELEQISELTGIDISAISDMAGYPEEEYLQYMLRGAKTDEEKNEILNKVEADRKELLGNIANVILTINSIIEKLSLIEDLNQCLIQTDIDSMNAKYYFSDFNQDKGQGYIGNNFGQDLRNFKRFLEFAFENRATTVWFSYG